MYATISHQVNVFRFRQKPEDPIDCLLINLFIVSMHLLHPGEYSVPMDGIAIIRNAD